MIVTRSTAFADFILGSYDFIRRLSNHQAPGLLIRVFTGWPSAGDDRWGADDDKQSYLLPIDANPDFPAGTAYRLEALY